MEGRLICFVCNHAIYENDDPEVEKVDQSLTGSFVVSHERTMRNLEMHFCCLMDLMESAKELINCAKD